jgi:nucleoid DNA-binding protein
MLGKNELAREIENRTGVKPNLAKRVMDTMAEICREELEKGEDFTVPGISKVFYRYTPARKKGETYKKGDTVKSPAGERVAEEDSKPRKASIKLKAQPMPGVRRHMPKSNDPEGQSAFLKGKVGKAIAKRKTR